MRNLKLDDYGKILRASKLRDTAARRAVFEVLLDSDEPLSPSEIFKLAGCKPNLASVYRVLSTFVEIALVKIVPRGFKPLYELGDAFEPHHHHVVCEKCGKIVAVSDEKIERIVRKVTIESGMEPTTHVIELYGICAKCAAKQNA